MGRGGKQTGGGSAGASGRKGADLSYQRQVPKFLQPYAHMLGGKPADEDEPVVLGRKHQQQSDEEDEEDGGEAVSGACFPFLLFPLFSSYLPGSRPNSLEHAWQRGLLPVACSAAPCAGAATTVSGHRAAWLPG